MSLNWICWTPPPEQNSWVRHWCLQILKAGILLKNGCSDSNEASQQPTIMGTNTIVHTNLITRLHNGTKILPIIRQNTHTHTHTHTHLPCTCNYLSPYTIQGKYINICHATACIHISHVNGTDIPLHSYKPFSVSQSLTLADVRMS